MSLKLTRLSWFMFLAYYKKKIVLSGIGNIFFQFQMVIIYMYINTCSIKRMRYFISSKRWDTCNMIYSTPRIILFYNIFNKFSHYASNEIILLFCPEKKLNHSGNSYIALPETIIFHKKYLYCSTKTVISPLRATILHIYLAFFIRIEGWCLPFIV